MPFASGSAVRARKGEGRGRRIKGRKEVTKAELQRKETNAHENTRVTASPPKAELFPLQLLWPERGRI